MTTIVTTSAPELLETFSNRAVWISAGAVDDDQPIEDFEPSPQLADEGDEEEEDEDTDDDEEDDEYEDADEEDEEDDAGEAQTSSDVDGGRTTP